MQVDDAGLGKQPMTIANRVLGFVILVALLLGACGLGNYAAYIAMLAALSIMALPANWGRLADPLLGASVRTFLLAYLALAIPIIVQWINGGTVETVLDFLPLALSVPAVIAFGALSAQHWPQRLFSLALAGSVISLAVVIYQGSVLQVSRPAGIENSPIHYGILSTTIGFLALGGFLFKPHWRTAPYLLGPVFGMAAALATGTRASVPAAAILAALALGIFVTMARPRFGQLAAVAAVSVLLAVPLAAGISILDADVLRAVSGVKEVFRAIQGQEVGNSFAYRLEQYAAFPQAFAGSPWIGHGWHRQIAALYPYLSEFGKHGYDQEQWGYIHNEALSLTLGMGVFGLAAYVLINLAPLVGITRIPRDTHFASRTYGVLVVVIGIFVGGLTDVMFMSELPKTFLVMITLAFLFAGRQKVLEHTNTGKH